MTSRWDQNMAYYHLIKGNQIFVYNLFYQFILLSFTFLISYIVESLFI